MDQPTDDKFKDEMSSRLFLTIVTQRVWRTLVIGFAMKGTRPNVSEVLDVFRQVEERVAVEADRKLPRLSARAVDPIIRKIHLETERFV